MRGRAWLSEDICAHKPQASSGSGTGGGKHICTIWWERRDQRAGDQQGKPLGRSCRRQSSLKTFPQAECHLFPSVHTWYRLIFPMLPNPLISRHFTWWMNQSQGKEDSLWGLFGKQEETEGLNSLSPGAKVRCVSSYTTPSSSARPGQVSSVHPRAEMPRPTAELDEGTATHSSILAGIIPWTEEPGRLQSLERQRARHDPACLHTRVHTHTHTQDSSIRVCAHGLYHYHYF